MFNDYSGHSGEALKMLHDQMRRSLENDRKLTDGEKRQANEIPGSQPPNFETDRKDFRIQVDAVEAEMTARGIPFDPIL